MHSGTPTSQMATMAAATAGNTTVNAAGAPRYLIYDPRENDSAVVVYNLENGNTHLLSPLAGALLNFRLHGGDAPPSLAEADPETLETLEWDLVELELLTQ